MQCNVIEHHPDWRRWLSPLFQCYGLMECTQGGITERISGDHVHRLWMENWASPDDSLTWHLTIPPEMAGDYHVRLLAASHFKMAAAYDGGSSPVTVELLTIVQGHDRESAAADKLDEGEVMSRVELEIRHEDAPVMMQFERIFARDLLRLPAGTCAVMLRAVAPPEDGAMNLQLLSVELAHATTLEALAREKAMLQADTQWLQQVPALCAFVLLGCW